MNVVWFILGAGCAIVLVALTNHTSIFAWFGRLNDAAQVGLVVPLTTILGWFVLHALGERKAKKEREMELRKDIFLAACTAIYAGTEALRKLVRLELSHREIMAELAPHQAVFGKLHFAGSLAVIEAQKAFTRELIKSMTALATRREPLAEKYQHCLSFIEALKARILQNDMSATLEYQRWIAEKLKLEKEECMPFMHEVMEAAVPLQKLAADFICVARDELGMPIDLARFEGTVDKGAANNRRVFASVKEKVE